jgi:hypothetical protein
MRTYDFNGNPILYLCGNKYLGFKDDVLRCCEDCPSLKAVEKSVAAFYMMPCMMSNKPKQGEGCERKNM